MAINDGSRDDSIALQSRFPILICNESAAEAWFFSHGSHYHTFFSVQAQTEIVEECWR